MAVPIAVISLLLVLVLTVLIIRTGAIAFTMTGMSEDVATFQAASAFSGAGFTTEEAEDAVLTSQRRRITHMLILSGGVGVVAAISTLVVSFSGSGGGGSLEYRFAYVVVGAIVIVAFAQSKWFDRLLSPVLRRLLAETTTLGDTEYDHLLKLSDGYRVSEFTVKEDGWMVGQSLRDLDLFAEGVVVLGVHRADGQFISPPDPDVTFHTDESLVVYGHKNRVVELSTRDVYDTTAHREAVEEHEQGVESTESGS